MVRLRRLPWRWILAVLISAGSAGLAACGILAALRIAVLVSDPLQPAYEDLPRIKAADATMHSRDLQHDVASDHPAEQPRGALPVAQPASRVVPASAMPEAPRCRPGLRLRGTVIVAGQPDRSMAALSTGRGTVLLHVGEAFDGARLAALRSDRAYMVREHSACLLPLYLPAAERSRVKQLAAKKPKEARPSRPSAFTQEELAQAIRRTGTDRYTISRDFIRPALAKLAGMRGLGRFVPALDDGKRVGMRVHGVRRDSLLARIGIRNGDVLRTLNGVALSSTDGIFEAYGLLRDRSSLSLALLRSGEPRTLEYIVE